jgi:DNA polymerase
VYQLRVNTAEAKSAVEIYRETHPKVKSLWYATENACLAAVREPGTVQTFGGRRNLKATVRGSYLYIILPSGRPLCYAAPRIEERLAPWGEMKDSLAYMGVDPFTHQWGLLSTYGGALVENIVQAVARDLLAEAMLRAEARGYIPILSVHDEIVTEVPVGFGSVKEFEQLMSELPAWATGCPVAAEGFRGFRYRK